MNKMMRTCVMRDKRVREKKEERRPEEEVGKGLYIVVGERVKREVTYAQY